MRVMARMKVTSEEMLNVALEVILSDIKKNDDYNRDLSCEIDGRIRKLHTIILGP